MTELPELTRAVEEAFVAHGFAVKRGLDVAETRFDLVAEDETRLIFVALRGKNAGWLDDFYDRQSALASTVSQLRLGRKWRDVYLLEVTTEGLESPHDLEVAEEIQSNTIVARKLVIDASKVDITNKAGLQALLAPILSGPEIVGRIGDIDVLGSLRERLVQRKLSRRMVGRLIQEFNDDGHDCVEIILEEPQ